MKFQYLDVLIHLNEEFLIMIKLDHNIDVTL